MKPGIIVIEPVLYAFPGACSLASHIALEMTEQPFSVQFIDLRSGEQRRPEYLAIHPRGKVPALVSGGQVITENVAILSWIAQCHPEANVLPPVATEQGIAALSDIVWLASAVHPSATRALAPHMFVEGEGEASVKASGLTALRKELTIAEERLSGKDWWFDAFSAVDAYLFVLWSRVGGVAVDPADFRALASHGLRSQEVPAVQRALAREVGAF